MLFTLSIVAFCCLVLLTAWIYRHRLADSPYVPRRLAAHFRQYQPLSTFAAASTAFDTATFDLSGNLEGDTRSGLDEESLTEIRRLMDGRRITFDEARYLLAQRQMRKAGIDPNTGLPLDSKAVTSL